MEHLPPEPEQRDGPIPLDYAGPRPGRPRELPVVARVVVLTLSLIALVLVGPILILYFLLSMQGPIDREQLQILSAGILVLVVGLVGRWMSIRF